ncbi:immunity 42 family protein [Limnobaculum parvum]|nr:immunity 42 family protein [Limnobaculum parvum]
MVFGDPNNFAILMELVPPWSLEDNYKNGLFHFIIDGKLFPDSAGVATLSGDVSCLSEDNALLSPLEDSILFSLDKIEAFSTMLRAMLPTLLDPNVDVPDDFETNYSYQASTYNLEDNACYVFAVSSGDEIRILGAKTSYLSGNDIDGYKWINCEHLDVAEVILQKEEVHKIVNEIKMQFTLINKL